MSPYPVTVICRVLGVSRSTAYRSLAPRGPFYHKAKDELVARQIRVVVKTRATYGHRRVTARVNRLFGTRYNRKRIRRVMRLYGLTLPKVNRRRGRAHTGRIMRDGSNERWCSDELVIGCWDGEVVHVAFALDCHDREMIGHVAHARPLVAGDIQELMQRAVAHRFGAARPVEPIQWLSDNGSIYTALATEWEAERLALRQRSPSPVNNTDNISPGGSRWVNCRRSVATHSGQAKKPLCICRRNLCDMFLALATSLCNNAQHLWQEHRYVMHARLQLHRGRKHWP